MPDRRSPSSGPTTSTADIISPAPIPTPAISFISMAQRTRPIVRAERSVSVRLAEEVQEMLRRGDGKLISPSLPNHQRHRQKFERHRVICWLIPKRNHPLWMLPSAGRRTNVWRRRGLAARTVRDFHAPKMYCFCTADLRLGRFSPLLTKDQRHLQNPRQRWFSLYF